MYKILKIVINNIIERYLVYSLCEEFKEQLRWYACKITYDFYKDDGTKYYKMHFKIVIENGDYPITLHRDLAIEPNRIPFLTTKDISDKAHKFMKYTDTTKSEVTLGKKTNLWMYDKNKEG